MLKNKLAIMFACGLLLAVAMPGMAVTGPARSGHAAPAVSLLDRLVDGWILFWSGTLPGRDARHASTPKNGCGIDPQGQPLCATGGGAGSGATATTTDPGN